MSRGSKALRTVIAIGFLYANAAVISAPVAGRFLGGAGLPLPSVVADSFYVFGVFSYYETWNRELVVEGLAGSRWIRLDLRDLLPFSRGERLTRAWADRRTGDIERWPQHVAIRRLARRMRARWNRLHPDRRVSRIRIVQESWPRSRQGYETEKKEPVRRDVWLAE